MTRALIFDCDGVLADTERFAHLPAFNRTFAEVGLPVVWSEEHYGEVLVIGGGKERMATLLTPEFVAEHGLPADEAGQRALLLDWHRRKTAFYTDQITAGHLPPRPGVARLVAEAKRAGWLLAVASTSAPASVMAVLEMVVGTEGARDFQVFAGDQAKAKKPAPDVYLLALAGLGVTASDAVAIEDSNQGLRAATAAGIPTVVTISSYTGGEDFSSARLVLSDLGEPGAPMSVLENPAGLALEDMLTLDDLEHLGRLT